MSALWITLKVTALAVLLAAVPGTLIAWWLSRTQSRAKLVVEGIVMLPLVLPPIATGFVILFLLAQTEWIRPLTWPAAGIACSIIALPLLVQSARAAFEGVDRNLEGIALTLGASRGRVFRTITLPLAWRGIAAGLLLAACRALGEFGATLVVAGNIPGRTQTLPLLMYNHVVTGRDTAAFQILGLLSVLCFAVVGLSFWVRKR